MELRRYHIIFFLLFPIFLFGQVRVELGMNTDTLIGNPSVKALYVANNVSFDSVQKMTFSKSYNFLDTVGDKKALWLKFNVLNTDSVGAYFYLQSYADFYTVYQESEDGWIEAKNGMLTSLKERTNKETFLFAPIYLKPSRLTPIYVRLSSHPQLGIQYPILVDQSYYNKKLTFIKSANRPAYNITLIYLAGISVIFLFVLILYLSVKDAVYLYYLLFLFFQIIFTLTIYEYVPMKPIKWALNYAVNSHAISESALFTAIGFYVFFLIRLLGIARGSLLRKFMKALAWAVFAYALVIFVVGLGSPNFYTLQHVFSIARLIILPINFLLVGWIIIKIKHPLISYFVAAHIFFFVGALLSFLIYLFPWLEQISIFDFLGNAPSFFRLGLLGEALCFSLAIAYRLRIIQTEKERSQGAYINQLRQNRALQEQMNTELDQKVKEKTEELMQAYAQMEQQKEREIKMEFTQKLNEMEVVALRSQMNPHFLFNCMNAIKYLIMTNRNEDAMNYLDDFSKLLRNVLRNSQRDTITVEDEMEILELYLSMEKGRLGDDFNYEITACDKEALAMYPVPSLLLQPFVENAIWHGLNPSEKNDKFLSIKFELADSLVISIQDNGIGREAARKWKETQNSTHKSMGVKITQDRLALFNHTHDMKIYLHITDLIEYGMPSGTLVRFTYLN